MKKKVILVLVSLIWLSLFTKGFSISQNLPIVKILGPTRGSSELIEAWEEVMKNFEEETGIKVEARWQGNWWEMPQNLSAAKMAKEQVDLIIVGAGTLRSLLVPSGAIMNITDLMKDLIDRFNPGMLDAFWIGGKLWGFPYADASASVFFYNQDMFNTIGIEPPKSYEEFLEICEILKTKNIQPVIFQGKENWAWPMLFFETYEQTSENTSIERVEKFLKGEIGFDSPIEEKAFALVKKLFEDGIFVRESLETDREGMRASFIQKKAAMFYGGTWEYPPIKDLVDFEIGVFEFPLIVDTIGVKPRHGFGVGDWGIAIPSFANENNLENTMRFVEYLLRPEVANKILSIEDPMVEVIKGLEIKKTPINEYVNNVVLPHSVLFLDWIWPAEINDAFCECIPAVVGGYMTPIQATHIIEETLKTIKKEKGYKYDWWSSWTQDDWAKVTPSFIPDIKKYLY